MPRGAGHRPDALRVLSARLSRAQNAAKATALCGILGLVVGSAIIAKEMKTAPALASIELLSTTASAATPYNAPAPSTLTRPIPIVEPEPVLTPVAQTKPLPPVGLPSVHHDAFFTPVNPLDQFKAARAKWGNLLDDASVRWFNGRPVRPVSVMWMTVTGYSPDARSCGESADGLTATLHHVETNAFRLVAADPTVLPYGSMVTVGGYAEDHIVPVLDCGGAIKGRRLDCLFPTHEQAKKWGRQRIKVIVWGYADGGPRENPRKSR